METTRESTRLAQPDDAPERDDDVGARIQAVRLCLGLSVPQMAELMRITPDEIEQAERGEDSASYSLVAIVVPLGALTGASADWLLFGRRGMWRPGGPFVAPQPGAAAMIDRAMVEAWESWVAARRAVSALPYRAPEDEEEGLEGVADRGEAVITWTPAATAMARAVKLRLLFSRDGGSRIAQYAMVFGEAVPDEYLQDSSRMLWELLQDAERQARQETAHPDALLLALDREFEAAWAKERAAIEATDDDSACDAAVDITSPVVERIARAPARTLAGLGVKAKALTWCQGYDPERPQEPCGTTEGRIEFGIACDVAAMHEA